MGRRHAVARFNTQLAAWILPPKHRELREVWLSELWDIEHGDDALESWGLGYNSYGLGYIKTAIQLRGTPAWAVSTLPTGLLVLSVPVVAHVGALALLVFVCSQIYRLTRRILSVLGLVVRPLTLGVGALSGLIYAILVASTVVQSRFGDGRELLALAAFCASVWLLSRVGRTSSYDNWADLAWRLPRSQFEQWRSMMMAQHPGRKWNGWGDNFASLLALCATIAIGGATAASRWPNAPSGVEPVLVALSGLAMAGAACLLLAAAVQVLAVYPIAVQVLVAAYRPLGRKTPPPTLDLMRAEGFETHALDRAIDTHTAPGFWLAYTAAYASGVAPRSIRAAELHDVNRSLHARRDQLLWSYAMDEDGEILTGFGFLHPPPSTWLVGILSWWCLMTSAFYGHYLDWWELQFREGVLMAIGAAGAAAVFHLTYTSNYQAWYQRLAPDLLPTEGGPPAVLDRMHTAWQQDLPRFEMMELGVTELPVTVQPRGGWLLEALHASMPPLARRVVNRQAVARIQKASAAQLESLDLSNLGLAEIPPALFQLESLQCLDLSRNQLSRIPPEIARLTELQRLVLDDNELTSLPNELGSAHRLTALSIARNRLTTIPTSVCDLAALETLDLTGNRLSELPERIGELRQLRRLVVNANRITRLPKSIGHLSELRYLHGRDNCLDYLPVEVLRLKNLATSSGHYYFMSDPFVREPGTDYSYLRDMDGGVRAVGLDFSHNRIFLPFIYDDDWRFCSTAWILEDLRKIHAEDNRRQDRWWLPAADR